jgi:hypothetical protein
MDTRSRIVLLMLLILIGLSIYASTMGSSCDMEEGYRGRGRAWGWGRRFGAWRRWGWGGPYQGGYYPYPYYSTLIYPDVQYIY